MNRIVLPGGTIGVLGGGQLGRMMALAARRMGYRLVVLDPSPRCPTAQVCDGVVVGALDDRESAKHLARQVDVITLDTEHVPADLLAELETIVPVLGVPVQSAALQGLDSLLSIVQMPGGVPVGALAIGKAGARNAGLLAVAILATSRPELADRLRAFREHQTSQVRAAELP